MTTHGCAEVTGRDTERTTLTTGQGLLSSFPHLSCHLAGDHLLSIMLRTYLLSSSISLGPKLIPLLQQRTWWTNNPRKSTSMSAIFRNSFGRRSFAVAMTVAVGGGIIIEKIIQKFENHCETSCCCLLSTDRCDHTTYARVRKTFMANVLSSLLAIRLLQSRNRRNSSKSAENTPLQRLQHNGPPNIDLTLLVFVRAFDALCRVVFLRELDTPADAKGRRREGEISPEQVKPRTLELAKFSSKYDAMIFWAASARYELLNIVQ